jgi:hypothetical protein
VGAFSLRAFLISPATPRWWSGNWVDNPMIRLLRLNEPLDQPRSPRIIRAGAGGGGGGGAGAATGCGGGGGGGGGTHPTRSKVGSTTATMAALRNNLRPPNFSATLVISSSTVETVVGIAQSTSDCSNDKRRGATLVPSPRHRSAPSCGAPLLRSRREAPWGR